MILANNYQYTKQKVSFKNPQTSSQEYKEKPILVPAVCSFILPGTGQMIQDGYKTKEVKNAISSLVIPLLGGVGLAVLGKFIKKDFVVNFSEDLAFILALLPRIHSVFGVINPDSAKK